MYLFVLPDYTYIANISINGVHVLEIGGWQAQICTQNFLFSFNYKKGLVSE